MSSTATQADMVNAPPHYRTAAGIEVIDVIERYRLDEAHHLATAIAYLLRAGKKTADPREDVAKALWYLRRWRPLFVDDETLVPNAEETLEWCGPERVVEIFGVSDPHLAEAVEAVLGLSVFIFEESTPIEELDGAITALETFLATQRGAA